jgi:hypothetical protein
MCCMLEDVSMLYNILIICHYFLTNGQMKTPSSPVVDELKT